MSFFLCQICIKAKFLRWRSQRMHERTCIVVIPDAINNDININNINSDMDNDSMNSDGPLEGDESNTP